MELRFEEVIGGECGEGRRELRSYLAHISTVDDRVDNRGVRTGSTNALAFERTDERSLGVTRRRPCLVAERLHIVAIGGVALLQLRQRRLLILDGGIRNIAALDISTEEARSEERRGGRE